MNGAAAPALGPCPFCGQPHPEDVLVCPAEGKFMPLEGRLLDGKFRFTRLLGAGGMGAVWRAQNIRVKKGVAIKLMHPEFAGNPGILDRFRKEATAAGEIGNSHICDIYDFGQSVLGPYIVLELLNGKSLGDLVQQSGRVDPGLVVLIIRQALVGLDAAHAVGIVHRDLKPENIFLHEPQPGRLLVKLMDFGISKFSQAGSEGGRTSAGVLMGTPEYMSPEQTEGAAGVDSRTDIWAIGAIMYKALTGADAFGGSTMAATLVAVSTKPHTPIAQLAPHVPPGLIAVIDRCLAKEKEQRFGSCAELSAALAPFEQLGAPLPAIGGAMTQAPMTAVPLTNAPISQPPQQGATMITGGPPPGHQPQQHTLITGGPPPPSGPGGTLGPAPQKATWSSEIAKPTGADDSWSLGGGATETRPPTTLSGSSSGGGGKGLIIGLVVLLLIGGGAGAYFVLNKPKGGGEVTPPGTTAGAVAATAGETKTEPETKVDDTKTGDTKVDTKTGDTKTGDTGDTKTGDTKTGDTGDTKTGDTGDTKVDDDKKDDDKKDDDPKKPKPTKEQVLSVDFPERLPGKMKWEEAKAYCDGLALGGVKSWRLARSGELLKFKKNTKLGARKYWTSESSAGRAKTVEFPAGKIEDAAANLGIAYPLCIALK
jgi:hypothetical protein